MFLQRLSRVFHLLRVFLHVRTVLGDNIRQFLNADRSRLNLLRRCPLFFRDSRHIGRGIVYFMHFLYHSLHDPFRQSDVSRLTYCLQNDALRTLRLRLGELWRIF